MSLSEEDHYYPKWSWYYLLFVYLSHNFIIALLGNFLSIYYFIFAWTHINLFAKFMICGNLWVKFPQLDKKWKFVKAFIVKIISKITEIRWTIGRHGTSLMWLIINSLCLEFIFLVSTTELRYDVKSMIFSLQSIHELNKNIFVHCEHLEVFM